jgi:hypothetical protein
MKSSIDGGKTPPNSKPVTKSSVARGAALLDYALSEGKMELSIPDAVGVVAALLARGHDPEDAEQYLGGIFSAQAIDQVRMAFRLFNGPDGGRLWCQRGPAMDDIGFTDKTLLKAYPHLHMQGDVPF